MTLPPTNQQDNAGTATQLSRKEQFLEVSVFLFLIVPSMALSLFAVRQGKLSFPITASAILLRDLALVCLILFFLWRNGESAREDRLDFRQQIVERSCPGRRAFHPFFRGCGLRGIRCQKGRTDRTGNAAALFPDRAGPAAAFPRLPSRRRRGGVGGNDFPRIPPAPFCAMMGSLAMAVISSSLIFSLGHGYEGTAGLATVGVMAPPWPSCTSGGAAW